MEARGDDGHFTFYSLRDDRVLVHMDQASVAHEDAPVSDDHHRKPACRWR